MFLQQIEQIGKYPLLQFSAVIIAMSVGFSIFRSNSVEVKFNDNQMVLSRNYERIRTASEKLGEQADEMRNNDYIELENKYQALLHQSSGKTKRELQKLAPHINQLEHSQDKVIEIQSKIEETKSDLEKVRDSIETDL